MIQTLVLLERLEGVASCAIGRKYVYLKYLKSFQFNLPAWECRRIVKMQKFHFLQSDISPETVKPRSVSLFAIIA